MSNSQPKTYSLRQLRQATDNFRAGRLGEGACGIVYKGNLDGYMVAIKRLKLENIQIPSNHIFINEINMPKHRNLLPLIGYCQSEAPEEMLLVFPLMVNGNLLSCLGSSKLDWGKRKTIAYQTAVGLAYLHSNDIVHRDVKAENILLDKNFKAVVADFGMVRHLEGRTHVTTYPQGTNGYFAPEYVNHSRCSYKIDVYSYGVLLLEIITGKRACTILPASEDQSQRLVVWIARVVNSNQGVARLVDSKLRGNYDPTEAKKLINLALECTKESPDERPTMAQVVQML